MINQYQQFITEFLNAWNAHDAERLAAFYDAEFEGQDVGQNSVQHGIDGVRESYANYLRAFPDLHFTAQHMIADNDQIALLWTARGTHNGSVMNIPATGRAVTVMGVSWLTLRDGKVYRALQVWDVAGLLRHLGLLPEL